jgi:hypothetical protein
MKMHHSSAITLFHPLRTIIVINEHDTLLGPVFCGMVSMGKKRRDSGAADLINDVDNAIVHVAALCYKDLCKKRVLIIAYLNVWNANLGIIRSFTWIGIVLTMSPICSAI